jgi:hypothetical protein
MTDEQPEQPLLTSDDLTEEQRAWQPANDLDAVQTWPTVHKVENWDGVLRYYAVEEWDWRSVAMAARTFPGVRVELLDPWHLAVPLGH